MHPHRFAGLAAATLAATVYGINIPFARVADEAGVPGPDLVLYRVGLMIVVIVLAALATRESLAIDRPGLTEALPLGAATAIVGIAYLSSVAFIPVGVAVMVFYTFPLVILVTSPFVDGERLTPARMAVFAIAFLGLAVAIGPGLAGLDPRGLALAAFASLGAAAQFHVGARAMRRVPVWPLMLWVQIVVAPLAAATALAFGGPVAPATVAAAWLAVGINAVCFVAGFLMQMRAVKLAPPAIVGLVFTLEPIVSIVTAALVLGECLSVGQYAGGLMVLAGLAGAVAIEMREARPDRASAEVET